MKNERNHGTNERTNQHNPTETHDRVAAISKVHTNIWLRRNWEGKHAMLVLKPSNAINLRPTRPTKKTVGTAVSVGICSFFVGWVWPRNTTFDRFNTVTTWYMLS